MHLLGPIKTFFWPLKEDSCWFPFQQILCKVSAPHTATGRSYNITSNDFHVIVKAYAVGHGYSTRIAIGPVRQFQCLQRAR